MRARDKAMWVALSLSALLLLHGQAYALSIGQGTYHVKFNDAEALYTGAGPAALGVPVAAPLAIALGDVLRGVSTLNAFQYHATHSNVLAAVYDSTVDEVASVTYGLAVSHLLAAPDPFGAPGSTIVEVGFMPATVGPGGPPFFPWTDKNVQPGSFAVSPALGFGGHNDLYLDNKTLGGYTAYSSAPGAAGFIAGGAGPGKHSAAMLFGGDGYSGINTAADPDVLLAETVFAPLPIAAMFASGTCSAACLVGEVLVARLFVSPAGSITGGIGKGFLNIIGGPFGPTVMPGGIPGDVLANYDATGFLTPAMAAALGYDISLEVKFGAPGPGWLASTEDPMHFTVVPEPTSMLLFGTMMVGLGMAGRVLRRRSRQT